MIKELLCMFVLLPLTIILIPILFLWSFWLVKSNWIPVNTELNKHRDKNFQYPTSYWKTWWFYTKDNFWEEPFWAEILQYPN